MESKEGGLRLDVEREASYTRFAERIPKGGGGEGLRKRQETHQSLFVTDFG